MKVSSEIHRASLKSIKIISIYLYNKVKSESKSMQEKIA